MVALFSLFHFTYSLDSVIDSFPQVPQFEIYSMYSLLIFIRIASYLDSFISAFVLKLTASRHHLRPPPVIIMDAQWQQYYWNHYLLQQHQHQLASGTDAAQYTPTTTYGPMGHSIRMHQQHQAHPYTPPPSTSPPSHTPPTSTSPAFPPPPPPPLPTASPTTPQPKSFKHSPTHSAPPAPPPTVPSPTPTIQESWHSTESCWDTNAVHGHQLHRHIQPNGPDVSGSQACRLSRCSLGYLRTMGRRTLQPGRSVTASFAGSFLRGVSPSQFSPHISFRRFAISVWT